MCLTHIAIARHAGTTKRRIIPSDFARKEYIKSITSDVKNTNYYYWAVARRKNMTKHMINGRSFENLDECLAYIESIEDEGNVLDR